MRNQSAAPTLPFHLHLGGLVLALALFLAGCSGGDTKDDPAPPATTPVTTSNDVCAVPPAQFTSTVWPSMEARCVICHASGRAAGGSRLLFALGANAAPQNYSALRAYVAGTGDTLLQKSIGLLSHGGGAPYVDANSQPYKDLAALMPTLQQTCVAPMPSVPAQAAGFWSGVSFTDDAKALSSAAILFAGRNPNAGELAAAGNATMLRQTIRGYMQGPAFDRFLDEAGMTQFLTLRVVTRNNNRGLVNADFPALANLAAADQGRFDSSMRREPIELMKFIVNGDRPWTDMVAGNYTVVNGVLAQYLGAQVQGTFTNVADDTEWRQATIPEARLSATREHAGVLSTHAWLDSFPTTATNRNRHRVYVLAKQFLATDVNALAQRPIDDGGRFVMPTVENPACSACHDTIDPIAAGFSNWAENNRFLPFKSGGGKDIALPNSYRSNNYPKDAAGRAFYAEGDNWFRDEKAPGYGGTPMPGGVQGSPTALQWLGQQVAADQRFAMGAVHFWYEAVFGREPLSAPVDQTGPSAAQQLAAYTAQHQEFEEIAARFKAGGYRVKDLLADLVLSRWFRADKATGATASASRALELADLGSANLLLPTQLNLKLAGLTGQAWADFNNPYAGLALNYGDFDGNTRTARAKSFTMMQAVTIDRLVATRSCAIAKADFDKPAASRLLFPNVNLSDTPATGRDAIVQNAIHLHKWLWKQDASATDPEVQRTVKLFEDVWNDRATPSAKTVSCVYTAGNDANYTGRAWAAVLAYMLGDPAFLYE